jgi:hypothetical protein
MYVAARYSRPSTGFKDLVLGRLGTMADELAMRKAAVVAEILERREEQNPWNVYTVLGGYAFAA